MDIWEVDKLFLFILFVVPGFISIKFYQLFYPGSAVPISEQLVDAVSYSCINYAFLFWLVRIVEASQLDVVHPWLYYLFYVFVFVLAPALWVLVWKWIRTRNLFQRNAPHPIAKPWDFVFQQGKLYWIIIYMKDGRRIAGKYGVGSFASSAPAEEQLYLSESWVMEGDVLDRAVDQTAGVLILSSEISHIEFFHY